MFLGVDATLRTGRHALQLFAYLGCNLGKLLWSERKLRIAEEHVALLLQRDEVDVCMRHLHAQHGHTDTLAGESCFQGLGYLLGKEIQASQLLIFKVKDVVDLMLGDNECVSLHHGVDIEEGKVVLILGHLVAGDLACHDSAEYACHDVMRC